MGSLRNVGVLTKTKITLLKQIQEVWDREKIPPRIVDLISSDGHEFSGSTVVYHLRELVSWGYLDITKRGKTTCGWRWTDKTRALFSWDCEINVVGRGDRR